MAIEVCTERWEVSHKAKPRGNGFWEFRCVHPKKGSVMVSTDGPYPQARDNALARFRQAFGRRANLKAELLP
jgi:hypothetical protein